MVYRALNLSHVLVVTDSRFLFSGHIQVINTSSPLYGPDYLGAAADVPSVYGIFEEALPNTSTKIEVIELLRGFVFSGVDVHS